MYPDYLNYSQWALFIDLNTHVYYSILYAYNVNKYKPFCHSKQANLGTRNKPFRYSNINLQYCTYHVVVIT